MTKKLLVLFAALFATSAFATNQDHTCQGGNNCNTDTGGSAPSTSNSESNSNADADALALGVGVGIAGGGDADAHSNSFAGGGDADSNALAIGGDNKAYGGNGFGGSAHQGQSLDNDLTNINGQGQHQGQGQGQSLDSTNVNSNRASNVSSDYNANDLGQSQTNEGNALSTSYNSDFESKAYALGVTSANAAPAVSGQCLVHLRGYGAFSVGSSGRTKFDKKCVAFERCMAIADRLFAWGQPALALNQIDTCSGSDFGEAEAVTYPVDENYVTQEQLEHVTRDLLAK